MEKVRLTERQETILKERVVDVKFTRVTPRTIFCVLVLSDGWETYGISACKDMDKFNQETGERFAFLHAISRLEYDVDNILKV